MCIFQDFVWASANVQREDLVVVARRNQLWILLSFFVCVGLFSGLAIWQISQFQQKERELARARNELKQTTDQMQVLKAQNTAALSSKGKLQKDLATVKKQLATVQQQGAVLEQQFKTLQGESSTLAAENSTLKVKLAAAERQITVLQQALKPAAVAKPTSTTEPLIPRR